MKISLTSMSVPIIMMSLTACSGLQPEPSTSGKNAIESNELMQSTIDVSDGSSLIILDASNQEMNVQDNLKVKLTREEQIQLALESAKTDHVTPMLMDRPTNSLIYFSFSNYLVEDSWLPLLKEHVNYISSEVSARLMVAGFTDKKGSAKFNYKLGKKRANEVCKALINLGARKEQLTCLSYGETHPVDPRDTDAAHARNRRVELIY